MSDAFLVLIFGYIFGSIPFGLILTLIAGLGDIRSIGSGNIGATNVLRTGRKGLAVATLLLDALKGAVPVLIVPWVFGSLDYSLANHVNSAALAGLGAFLGHVFPIWLRFRGGKGVATSVGVLLALNWQAGIFIIALWLLTAFVFRISSLAALVAALIAPLLAHLMGPKGTFIPVFLMVVLIYWAHKANIARLRAGVEPRIGTK